MAMLFAALHFLALGVGLGAIYGRAQALGKIAENGLRRIPGIKIPGGIIA